MSDLLATIRARTAEARAKDPANLRERPLPVALPPEAADHLARMRERHPEGRIEIERRIFIRHYDEHDVCDDVRNLPDQ